MRKSLLTLLLLLPVVTFAQDRHCKHAQARDLKLDIQGVKAVVFDIGPHELKLTASPNSKSTVQGHACASHAKSLAQLTLTQKRIGDKLVVRAQREGSSFGLFFGDQYAYLDLIGSLPDNVPVQLKVGSGDADVTGAATLSIDVGSGDVAARRILGLVTADVGSGDIELADIGSLQVVSIGSGDLEAAGVGHGVKIDRIGSGEAALREVAGDVEVDAIGSGELDARDVRGNLTVRAVGSGSVDHSRVGGSVNIAD